MNNIVWIVPPFSRILSVTMRRLVTMTIAMLLGLTLVAPLFALPAASDVPACCRRSGQHHCMGGMTSGSSADVGFSRVTPKCPRCPLAAPAPQLHGFVPNRSLQASVPVFARPTALPQTEARYRTAFARTRQKRGPPVILL